MRTVAIGTDRPAAAWMSSALVQGAQSSGTVVVTGVPVSVIP